MRYRFGCQRRSDEWRHLGQELRREDNEWEVDTCVDILVASNTLSYDRFVFESGLESDGTGGGEVRVGVL